MQGKVVQRAEVSRLELNGAISVVGTLRVSTLSIRMAGRTAGPEQKLSPPGSRLAPKNRYFPLQIQIQRKCKEVGRPARPARSRGSIP